MTNKKILTILTLAFFLLTIILFVGFVSAYERICLTNGDSIPPDSIDPVYTCNHNLCMVCINNNYHPVAPYRCNDISGCSTFGNGTLDITPPELTINSPVQDEVYDSRAVFLDIEVDERADITYYDNINGRGRWTRICNNCMGHQRSRGFKEGFNDITFKAKDVVGNEAEERVTFYIDSKKPKIRKTEPKKGFADGKFEVEFSEENPKILILNYGTQSDLRNAELDIENDCDLERTKYSCDVEVDLEDYDGQTIEYWFNLTDIADASTESKHLNLEVDTTFPVINNPTSFWEQGEGRYNKYIYFNISITEQNFDEVVYSYLNSRGRLIEKRLCSRLRDGVCETRKSFSSGEYDLTVQVVDEAGNSIGEGISFVVG